MLEAHYTMSHTQPVNSLVNRLFLPAYIRTRPQWSHLNEDELNEGATKWIEASSDFYQENVRQLGSRSFSHLFENDNSHAYRAHLSFVDAELCAYYSHQKLPDSLVEAALGSLDQLVKVSNRELQYGVPTQPQKLYGAYLSSSSSEIRRAAIEKLKDLSFAAQSAVVKEHIHNQKLFLETSAMQEEKRQWHIIHGQFNDYELYLIVEIVNDTTEEQVRERIKQLQNELQVIPELRDMRVSDIPRYINMIGKSVSFDDAGEHHIGEIIRDGVFALLDEKTEQVGTLINNYFRFTSEAELRQNGVGHAWDLHFVGGKVMTLRQQIDNPPSANEN